MDGQKKNKKSHHIEDIRRAFMMSFFSFSSISRSEDKYKYKEVIGKWMSK